MKSYKSLGIVFFGIAGCFALFALITWGLAHGDLFAVVEHTLPRGRRHRGSPTVVAYPAFVSITTALAYGAAILVSGIAHVRGSLPVLIVSAIIGVGAGVWGTVSGLVYGRDTQSAIFAIIVSVIAIALSLYSTITTARDKGRIPTAEEAAAAQAASIASLYPPAPGWLPGAPAGVQYSALPPAAHQAAPFPTPVPQPSPAGHMLPPRFWGVGRASGRR